MLGHHATIPEFFHAGSITRATGGCELSAEMHFRGKMGKLSDFEFLTSKSDSFRAPNGEID